MKRTLTLIVSILLLVAGSTAQKLNYSAVVRNGANELVTNANVTIKVAISPNPNGTPVVYSETHAVTTSPNGMVSLTIGDGTPETGSLSNVSWSTAYVISEFFLPDGSHTSAIMPVSAVPYALFTETISPQGLLDVVQSMTPEQIATLRDSMGIPKPEPISCDTMVDADGNRYASVQIGTQCWTKTNLRTTHYRNGGAIAENQNASSGAASYYRPAASDAVAEHYPDSVYGMYYNGYAVEGDTLCPDGWHVPAKAEWELLTTYMGGQNDYVCGGNPDYIARALAGTHRYTDQTGSTVYAWNHEDKNCAVGSDRGGNNKSGFSAFPAGYWETTFENYGRTARFWTSTPDNNQAWVSSLTYSEEMVTFYTGNKGQAISVRCLRDDAGDTVVHPTVTTDTATGVTSVKATLHGSYTNPHNLTLTSTGFEWKTVGEVDYHVANASGDTMSYELTGLLPDTQYTYRAFVATEDSVYYGEDVTFTTEPEPPFSCGTSQMIDADGNHYETVQIGEQCWIKTNLRTTKYRNGNPIPKDVNPDQSSSASFSRLSPEVVQDILEDIPTYSDLTFGFYYNWYAAADTGDSKLCPEGWHVFGMFLPKRTG